MEIGGSVENHASPGRWSESRDRRGPDRRCGVSVPARGQSVFTARCAPWNTWRNASVPARRQPANAGKSWSRAEDEQVCEELRRGIDFHQIAKTHNRTIGSIIARLVKLGKIGPNTPLDMFGPKVA